MKKSYSPPRLVSRDVQLGVFGEYGYDQPGGRGGEISVLPGGIKDIEPSQLRME